MIILLEHINFKIPFASGQRIVRDFFVDALGCPECPAGRMFVAVPGGALPVGTQKQMHVNLGLSQLHFEWCTGNGHPYATAQQFPGEIHIAVDSLADMQKRLTAKGHAFTRAVDDCIRFTCPFGSTWIASQASAVALAKVAAAAPVREGGVGHVVALTKVDFSIRPGIKDGVARFYKEAFDTWATATPEGCAVRTLADQVIAFTERADAPPPDAYESMGSKHGVHICLYVSDFEQQSRRNESRFWMNPDYVGPPINDHVSDSKEALERCQFRLKNVGPRFVLEHEVRGLGHKLAPNVSFL